MRKKDIGSFSLMKRMNTALILDSIRQHGTVSRIEIAKETGLTAATVSNLTAELIDNGLVMEFNTGLSTGGRKPILLKINADGFCIASAYISPTEIEFAVSRFDAQILCYNHCSLDSGMTPQQCIDFILRGLQSFQKNHDKKVIGLCVGTHGIVNSAEGIWVYAPNLNWKDVDIRSMLTEKTDIPVYVDNDVRLMTLGEMWFGIARGIPDFVSLYVGEGVGGAVVMENRLFRGYTDAAGEIGHTTIDTNGPMCKCGNRGCLQSFVNEEAMLSDLKRHLGQSSVLTEGSSCSDIVDAYLNTEDMVAKIVIEDEIRYLAVGIANIINTFNPRLVVLNSDIKDFDIAILDKVSAEVAHRCIAYLKNACEIRYSSLGKRAVLQGGIAMVLDTVYKNPQILWNEEN